MRTTPTLHAKVELLRSKIVTLQAERLAIESQPRSRSEVVAFAKNYVADLVEKARREAHLFLVRVAAGGGVHTYGTDLPAVLAPAANADAMLAFLLADIGLVAVGLEPAQKAKRLAEIEQILYALEVQEEFEIDAIELETGDYVLRRPDARPEIVLAMPAA